MLGWVVSSKMSRDGLATCNKVRGHKKCLTAIGPPATRLITLDITLMVVLLHGSTYP